MQKGAEHRLSRTAYHRNRKERIPMKKLSLLLALLMLLSCVFPAFAEVADTPADEEIIVIVEEEGDGGDEEASDGDSAGSAGFPGSSGEPEIEYTYSYTVKPLSGAVVHCHTPAQIAYLADPYVDGVINTPSIIEIDGVDYKIDGNPWSSSDLDTRVRTHEEYS